MSAWDPPTASHGIQMLYDAPSCVALKCFLNCSEVKAKRLSGTWLADFLCVSSKAYTTSFPSTGMASSLEL